ncbi:deoxyribodipyrimidine photo-lyase [Chryseobacterium sp. WG14]|uniref:deoxyribodipyrimidine photo-lyase n=1 Tax=Chryseobacterium sp. WG14 TaxID=2926909 RepID=UPI00211DC22E|nr:deoxyribodipyrimidine photo-lyase [Chryseobacterium sp. WG14]MCQ9637931.1 deoxyribodipyrimidine photo-lyase [Chryseobacterium sp. WG14]
MDKVNIFWFRRDLRLEDDSGLHHALDRERAVIEHTKARERALKLTRKHWQNNPLYTTH